MQNTLIHIICVVLCLVPIVYAQEVTDTLPDPFAPLNTPQSTPLFVSQNGIQANDPNSGSPYNLAAIVWNTTNPLAILGGTIMAPGSEWDSISITEVTRNSVTLSTPTGPKVLHMTGLISSTSAQRDKNLPPENTYCLQTRNAPTRTVLECLATQDNRNIVFATPVTGHITLRLNDVTWQKAFDSVLQAGGYTVTESQDTLTIVDGDNAIVTKTFPLNFANVKDMELSITKLLSAEGKLGVDNRLNSLIISDKNSTLKQIQQAITQLDVQSQQVLIDVLIVNVKLTHDFKLGINWSAVGKISSDRSVTLTQNLAATTGLNPYGQVDYSGPTGNWTLTGLLDFVQTHENIQVLANPKIMVLNNHTASIDSVEEIPYQELSETSGGGSIGTTAFKEAGVKLEVTPQISSDGYIVMNISPEQSAHIGDFVIEGSQTPVIEKRKAVTTLRVKNGQTIIIGGLRKTQPTKRVSRIPILGSLPLIGPLFRQVHNEEIESELGVFITPHIYTEDQTDTLKVNLLDQSAEQLYQNINAPRKTPGH